MLVAINLIDTDPEQSAEGWFLHRLLTRIQQHQPSINFLILTNAIRHDVFDAWEKVYLDNVGRGGVFGKRSGQLDRVVQNAGADIIFSPLTTAPVKAAVPVTVFALELRRWDDTYLKPDRRDMAMLKTLKRVCENAEGIVVPSEFVRGKFRDILEVPLNTVTVAPVGVDEVFGEPQAPIIDGPYILTVGSTNRFKNTHRLREAFIQLRDEIPHTLVVVGRAGDTEPQAWGTRVIRFDYCATRYLASLYQHCDVFIQPSLYEGSGIAVLEAMRSGARVVTTRAGGIAEIAHDIPVFFNPESVPSLIAAIRRVLEERDSEGEDRGHFGQKIASEHTWEQCVWKTLSAFRRKG